MHAAEENNKKLSQEILATHKEDKNFSTLLDACKKV
jgi:hypothetical protein